MVKSLPPPTSRQLGLMLVLITLPLIIGYTTTRYTGTVTPPDEIIAWVMLVLGVVLSVGIGFAMVKRHSITFEADSMIVRHTFYTLHIHRLENGPLTMDAVEDVEQLRLGIRTNGIDAFGFRSGRYVLLDGRFCFCAVSQGPLYRIDMQREGKAATLALSCDAATADAIRGWIGGEAQLREKFG